MLTKHSLHIHQQNNGIALYVTYENRCQLHAQVIPLGYKVKTGVYGQTFVHNLY